MQFHEDTYQQLADKAALINEWILASVSPNSDVDSMKVELVEEFAQVVGDIERLSDCHSCPTFDQAGGYIFPKYGRGSMLSPPSSRLFMFLMLANE